MICSAVIRSELLKFVSFAVSPIRIIIIQQKCDPFSNNTAWLNWNPQSLETRKGLLRYKNLKFFHLSSRKLVLSTVNGLVSLLLFLFVFCQQYSVDSYASLRNFDKPKGASQFGANKTQEGKPYEKLVTPAITTIII